MISLATAKVNKRVAKNKFQFNMPTVESIYWRYKVSAETTTLTSSEEHKELQIFEVKFLDNKIDVKVLAQIQKAIPYKILFLVCEKSYLALNTTVLKLESNLVVNDILEVQAKSIITLYEKLIEKFITIARKHNESLEDLVARHVQVEKLQKEIEKLERMRDKEKQPNKRIAINEEIARLMKLK